ncbi:MAG: M23 family metallopeptidase [Halanaerobiales bacterium]|nr:M23 family metallopeptidase [Halanaerobiales bacterium]
MCITKKHKITSVIFILLISLYLFISPILYADNLNKNLSLNTESIQQGDFLIVETPLTSTLNSVLFNTTKYNFNNSQDMKIAVIPVSYWITPNDYILTILGPNKEIKKTITVLSGNFANSYIEVDQDKESLIRPEKESTIQRKKEDQKLINKARQTSSLSNLWINSFIWPVKGPISTEFGATRFVNGSLQSRHSGIDIACQQGKSISATNNGIIKLATNLLITGNTIIIDHGWNIFSSYSHLSKVEVKKGDQVEKGQKIGEIGSTGFSTGPHLHWTITINGVFVNPRSIINNNIIN